MPKEFCRRGIDFLFYPCCNVRHVLYLRKKNHKEPTFTVLTKSMIVKFILKLFVEAKSQCYSLTAHECKLNINCFCNGFGNFFATILSILLAEMPSEGMLFRISV